MFCFKKSVIVVQEYPNKKEMYRMANKDKGAKTGKNRTHPANRTCIAEESVVIRQDYDPWPHIWSTWECFHAEELRSNGVSVTPGNCLGNVFSNADDNCHQCGRCKTIVGKHGKPGLFSLPENSLIFHRLSPNSRDIC
jgi:hypothetical protein